MACPPLPSTQPGEGPPSGITLQDGLQESHLCPDAHSWSPSCLPGQHNQGWVSLGISFSKIPEGARFSL